MEELSRQKGLELNWKLLQSKDADEILEISQQLGMKFNRQEAIEFVERNRKTAVLDEPQEN